MNKTAIILGVNADIGSNICQMLLNDGYRVIGTHRKELPEDNLLKNQLGLTLIQCDITRAEDIEKLLIFIEENQIRWNLIFSSIGSSEPIGRFFDLDFNDWEQSININFTGQLRAIHGLYQYRAQGVVDIALLAGGGTNNPFRCYSSYCVAKIGLIKMCELIDDEAEDVNIFILGPGFVRTKTHYETLRAGSNAELNLERVKEFMDSGEQGTSFADIYKCLQWGCSIGREYVGGRNFSVVHDAWGSSELERDLLQDPNMFKLRRNKN